MRFSECVSPGKPYIYRDHRFRLKSSYLNRFFEGKQERNRTHTERRVSLRSRTSDLSITLVLRLHTKNAEPPASSHRLSCWKHTQYGTSAIRALTPRLGSYTWLTLLSHRRLCPTTHRPVRLLLCHT